MAQRWIRSPEVVWRTSLERVVLLSPDADEPTVVTGPGVAVWLLTERPMTTPQLVSELARIYRAPRERIAGDVRELLNDLAGRALVREVPG